MNLQKIWSECVYLKTNLSLFKEIAIFSIISFKKGFISIVKYCFSFFWDFWCSSNCMGHEDCESVKDLVRMCLFEKKLTLYKEVAIFSIFSFKKGFISIVKYCYFPVLWYRINLMFMRTVHLQKIWSECAYLKKVVIM